MRKIILSALALLFFGCAGFEARHKTNSELKGRFAEIERELITYHPSEEDSTKFRRFLELTNEEHTVEGELLRRCRGGDQDAYLPRFR